MSARVHFTARTLPETKKFFVSFGEGKKVKGLGRALDEAAKSMGMKVEEPKFPAPKKPAKMKK